MERIKKLINNLKGKRIDAEYFESAEAVKAKIISEITKEDTVGIGGSMTIFDLKLHEELIKAGNEVYWHWLVEPEKRGQVRQKAATADIYLTSTNALTEAGELVNIDGVGNRVASMFYGPKKVIVICGINKITTDIISAIDRIKEKACPSNARRLNLKVPCAFTDLCNDCTSEERMCNITTIINNKPMTVDLKVYIVGEELGY
ncbi:lactate utilization protein [Alkaliphilus serpentinus]|uniref:Lactate utilization protein n=1 Tax=Alkaliphilus serpentinus TaxID=1482731 RepID=A0A833HN07_9FIRM|nr:lactate utilization protein [Alkaliphilus serpentinus]KAB3529085.1 lactate utilization protein [Alkaliphilus serpentinus]